MNILPKTTLTFEVKPDGLRYAIISYSFLRWTATLYEIPVLLEFWPREVRTPLPKGTRFPKQPQPTEFESRLVSELIKSRGYKVLNKFWNWYGITLAQTCTSRVEGIETAQGMFQGFLRARLIPLQISQWGEEKAELEEEESMYVTQRRMDNEAPGAYY